MNPDHGIPAPHIHHLRDAEQRGDTIARADVVIVGAGIIGLAHAYAAWRRGLSVVVIERDSWAVGASIRNFGHVGVTAQSGDIHQLALRSRALWLHLGGEAGVAVKQSGAVAVARSDEELAVLEEFGAARGMDQVSPLTARNVSASLTGDHPRGLRGIRGGAFLSDDLRVDPRTAVATVATWLARQGVTFLWDTAVHRIEDDAVLTSRGAVVGEHTVVCAGHDLDHLLPHTAQKVGMRRCVLQMALVEPPAGLVIEPAVLTGTSMLRYSGFAETAAASRLRAQLERTRPDLMAAAANIMFTQRPDGMLIVGDSHHYAATAEPFLSETVADTLLLETARLLGVPELRVRQRWQGVYASSDDTPVLVERVAPRLSAVTVTSGLGMTIGLGLGDRVVAEL